MKIGKVNKSICVLINMDKKVKVNFGCSVSGIDGWVNVDNSMRHIIVSKIVFLPRIY